MLNWIRNKINPETDTAFYLPKDFCKSQSSEDLLDKLRYAEISAESKFMIITELLDRTFKFKEEKTTEENYENIT